MAKRETTKPEIVETRLMAPDGSQHVLLGMLYNPVGIIKCQFGTFSKYEIEDAISYPKGKIRRFIHLIK